MEKDRTLSECSSDGKVTPGPIDGASRAHREVMGGSHQELLPHTPESSSKFSILQGTSCSRAFGPGAAARCDSMSFLLSKIISRPSDCTGRHSQGLDLPDLGEESSTS
ncbi:Protein Tssc4 [Manis pentadactyla]|nr:Protein Tssc4 [Manis pentadactyla]